MAKKVATNEETAEVTATEVEKPKQPSQNGVTRPKPGTATGKVWEIADQLSADAKGPAPRGEVLKACEGEGINPSTAATQYGRWRKFFGLGRYAEKAAEKTAE